jgi:hypothetical protein
MSLNNCSDSIIILLVYCASFVYGCSTSAFEHVVYFTSMVALCGWRYHDLSCVGWKLGLAIRLTRDVS